MCGICGTVAKNGEASEDQLRAMIRQIWRRGPDGEGVFIDGRVALGMRRLAIIDLKDGDQPIFNEDGSVVVVFNGEIYNYQTLRKNLRAQGHIFRTQSDTEVLVHLYEEYGDKMVEHLEGMFVFAIYDRKDDRIVLGRDRLGVKPLFIANTRNAIVFGSEIKAVLQHDSVSTELDLQALDEYLTYTYVPCPKTIYTNIRKVPPAHLVIIDRNANVSLQRYWSLDETIDETQSLENWISICESQLQEAVAAHLVSDVPVGAFLSGGVDSSLIVAMMARATDAPVETFTVAFEDSGSSFIDERIYARELAKRYNLRHHEIMVRPRFEDIADEIVHAFDEPFADDSVIPTYYVCEATRKHVKVALSGLGGDELFGGYVRHLGLLVGEHYRRVPNILRRRLITPLVNRLRDPRQSGHFVDRLKRFVRADHWEAPRRYQDAVSSMPSEARIHLYSDSPAASVSTLDTEGIVADRFRQQMIGQSILESALRTDIDTYLVDDVLALTDRLSMWHSLEVRVPYLDHCFVETAAQIPARWKIHQGTQKYVLKRIAEKWVPASILRHKKQGFESPMARWLAGPLQGVLEHHLRRDHLERQGLFRFEPVKQLIDEHATGAQQNSKILFSLLMFQLWWLQNE